MKNNSEILQNKKLFERGKYSGSFTYTSSLER